MPTLRTTRVTFYNHKGGVGKTTLTVNTAFALAAMGKSVLLVDSDPQCNLTSYLLADDVVDDLLDHSDGPGGRTLWTSVKPLFDGTGDVTPVKPVTIGRIALLPGDIRLSEYEEFLSEAWTDSFKRRLGGLRATASIQQVTEAIVSDIQFDFIFYDTGPNIGALNRILLLGSDLFLVPVACDLFSVRALSTLGHSLRKWILDASTIASIAPDGSPLLAAAPRFLGYVPQQFKVYGRTMASEPAKYLRHIKRRVYENVSSVLRSIDENLAPEAAVDPLVGQVPDCPALVQIAQREGVPVWECSSTYRDQKEQVKSAFASIANAIVAASTPRKPSHRRK